MVLFLSRIYSTIVLRTVFTKSLPESLSFFFQSTVGVTYLSVLNHPDIRWSCLTGSHLILVSYLPFWNIDKLVLVVDYAGTTITFHLLDSAVIAAYIMWSRKGSLFKKRKWPNSLNTLVSDPSSLVRQTPSLTIRLTLFPSLSIYASLPDIDFRKDFDW